MRHLSVFWNPTQEAQKQLQTAKPKLKQFPTYTLFLLSASYFGWRSYPHWKPHNTHLDKSWASTSVMCSHPYSPFHSSDLFTLPQTPSLSQQQLLCSCSPPHWLSLLANNNLPKTRATHLEASKRMWVRNVSNKHKETIHVHRWVRSLSAQHPAYKF